MAGPGAVGGLSVFAQEHWQVLNKQAMLGLKHLRSHQATIYLANWVLADSRIELFLLNLQHTDYCSFSFWQLWYHHHIISRLAVVSSNVDVMTPVCTVEGRRFIIMLAIQLWCFLLPQTVCTCLFNTTISALNKYFPSPTNTRHPHTFQLLSICKSLPVSL